MHTQNGKDLNVDSGIILEEGEEALDPSLNAQARPAPTEMLGTSQSVLLTQSSTLTAVESKKKSVEPKKEGPKLTITEESSESKEGPEKKSKALPKSAPMETDVFHSLTFNDIEEHKLSHQEISWLYRLANENRPNRILQPFVSSTGRSREKGIAEEKTAREALNKKGISDHIIGLAFQGTPIKHLNEYLDITRTKFMAAEAKDKQAIALSLVNITVPFFMKAKKTELPKENEALLSYIDLILFMALEAGVDIEHSALTFLTSTRGDFLFNDITQRIETFLEKREARIRTHMDKHKENPESVFLRPLDSFMSNVNNRLNTKLKTEYQDLEKTQSKNIATREATAKAAKENSYLEALSEQKTDAFLKDAHVLIVGPAIRKNYRKTRAEILHLAKVEKVDGAPEEDRTLEAALESLSTKLSTAPHEAKAIAENLGRFDHFILSMQKIELSVTEADQKKPARSMKTRDEESISPIFKPKLDAFNALKRQYHKLLLDLASHGANLSPKQKTFITEGHFLSDKPQSNNFMMRAKDKEAYDNQRAYYQELAQLKDIPQHFPQKTLAPSEWISLPDPAAEAAKAALRNIVFVPWMFSNPSDDEMHAASKILLRIAKTGVTIPKELRLPAKALNYIEGGIGLGKDKVSNEASLRDIAALSILNLVPGDTETISLSKRLNFIIAHITSLPYTPAVVRFIHNMLAFTLVDNNSIDVQHDQKSDDVYCDYKPPKNKPEDTSHPLATLLYQKQHFFQSTSPRKHAGALRLIKHVMVEEKVKQMQKKKAAKVLHERRQAFRNLFNEHMGHPPQHLAAWGQLLRGEVPIDSISVQDKSFIDFLNERLQDPVMDANVKGAFPDTSLSLNEIKLFHIIPNIQRVLTHSCTAFKAELAEMQTSLKATVREESAAKQAHALEKIRITNEVLPRLKLLEKDKNLKGEAKKMEIDGRPIGMLGVLKNQNGATAESIMPKEYPALMGFVSAFLAIENELTLPETLSNPDHQDFKLSEAEIEAVNHQVQSKTAGQNNEKTPAQKTALEERNVERGKVMAAFHKRQNILFKHQQESPGEFMLHQVRQLFGKSIENGSTADYQRAVLMLISPWMIHDALFTQVLLNQMIRLEMFDEAIALAAQSNIGPSKTSEAFDTHFIGLMGLSSSLTRKTQKLFADVSERINEKFQSLFGVVSVAERTKTLQSLADKNDVVGLMTQSQRGDAKLTLEARNEKKLLASIYELLKDKEYCSVEWLKHAKVIIKSPAMEALLLKKPKAEELILQFSKRYEETFNEIVKELLASKVTANSKEPEKADWHEKYEKLIILQTFIEKRLLDEHPDINKLKTMALAIKGEKVTQSRTLTGPTSLALSGSTVKVWKKLLPETIKEKAEAKTKVAETPKVASTEETTAASRTPSPNTPKRMPPPLEPTVNGAPKKKEVGGLNLSFLGAIPAMNGDDDSEQNNGAAAQAPRKTGQFSPVTPENAFDYPGSI